MQRPEALLESHWVGGRLPCFCRERVRHGCNQTMHGGCLLQKTLVVFDRTLHVYVESFKELDARKVSACLFSTIDSCIHPGTVPWVPVRKPSSGENLWISMVQHDSRVMERQQQDLWPLHAPTWVFGRESCKCLTWAMKRWCWGAPSQLVRSGQREWCQRPGLGKDSVYVLYNKKISYKVSYLDIHNLVLYIKWLGYLYNLQRWTHQAAGPQNSVKSSHNNSKCKLNRQIAKYNYSMKSKMASVHMFSEVLKPQRQSIKLSDVKESLPSCALNIWLYDI